MSETHHTQQQEEFPLLSENREPIPKRSPVDSDGKQSQNEDTNTAKGSASSRFRKNKARREGRERAEEDILEGDADDKRLSRDNARGNGEERHRDTAEEEVGEDSGLQKKKEESGRARGDNCCLPVAICLSSCLGGLGLGFRNSGDFETDISPTGRVVDRRMWEVVKQSASFKSAEDAAFCINIGRLSDLQGVLGSAVKPFIKVHVVNIDTGHYVRPSSAGKVTVPRAAPLLTRQAGLLGTPSDVPSWNEDLVFPTLTFKDVVSPRNLILFEVLDDPPSLSFRKAQQSINAGKHMGTAARTYTTLAWAFLLPVGQKINVGYPQIKQALQNKNTEESEDAQQPPSTDFVHWDLTLRLQLYQYRADTVVTRLQRIANRWPAAERFQQKRRKTESAHRYPDNIPEVYLQYQRRHLDLLSSVLEIGTGTRAPPLASSTGDQAGEALHPGGDGQPQALDPRSSQAHEDVVKAQLRAAKMKRSRAVNEPCVIPNKLLHRVDAGPEGAMVASFSHKGHLLALAGAAPGYSSAGSSSVPFAPVGGTSPYAHLSYSVRLLDPDSGVEVWSDLFAHFGVIYDIQWSLSDTFFVTCSSDGTCKIWRFLSAGDEAVAKSAEGGGNASPQRAAVEDKRRRRSSMSGVGAQAAVAIAAFQEFPILMATLAHSPPVYIYSAIFQEFQVGTGKSDGPGSKLASWHPPVITGAADGRIRMWKSGVLEGDLVIGEGGGGGRKPQGARGGGKGGVISEDNISTEYHVDPNDVPHQGALVQALVIDVRSKYLFSGDSVGQILIWRMNNSGWYQLLRKFRKDDLAGRSISSLSVYPDRAKGYLLVLALPALTDAPEVGASPFGRADSAGPTKILSSALLKLYDLGTYRAQHTFPGVVINNSFCRATFSADGRYATCGTVIRNHDGVEKNHVRVWSTITGRHQDTKIASLPYSYIPRSISWHPVQHVVAVAMVGQGAAVGIFCANKARAEDVVHDFPSAGADTSATEDKDMSSTASPTPHHAPMLLLSPSRLKNKFKRGVGGGGAAGGARRGAQAGDEGGEGSDVEVPEVRTKEQRAARTREILDKIKAAKARAKGEQL